jgi:hypothetical protein
MWIRQLSDAVWQNACKGLIRPHAAQPYQKVAARDRVTRRYEQSRVVADTFIFQSLLDSRKLPLLILMSSGDGSHTRLFILCFIHSVK